MNNNLVQENQVTLCGEICSDFTYSHEVFGEGFYVVEVSVNRLSNMVDTIPLLVSERLIEIDKDYVGLTIEVMGQFRSYNRHEGTKNRLVLSTFVRELKFVDEVPEEQNKANQIYLDGYICKPPVYRKTPMGREIADVLVAANRPYGKSDYIPCIAWGRNARFAGGLEVGTKLSICGRIQSRTYIKILEDGAKEDRTAYEVSVLKLEVVE